MLVKALSRKLSGYFVTFLFIATVAGCGGGGDSTGKTPESPIPGNTVLIEAKTAGGVMSARVNETVYLDGSKSYISSNQPSFTSTNAGLIYSWSFSHVPEGSAATLEGATSVNSSFVADVAGDYLVQLIVSANGYTSKRTVQLIVATEAGDRFPVGPYSGHLGLSSNCEQCHMGNKTFVDVNGVIKTIRGKSATHVATSQLCETCHTTRGFAIPVKTDHAEVFGNCSECHDGVKATGKSEFHQVTQLDCNQCHNTISFLELNPDGTYDHSNITRACAGCHDGKIARGKHDTHIDTVTDCGFCHTTVDFKNAYPDHTGPEVVGKACASCHNGTDAKDSAGFHPDMSVDCAVCHTVIKFNSGGVFDHTVIGVNPFLPACSECHAVSNNIGAIGKSVNHPVTSDVCSDCHNTVSFADVTNFDHGTLASGKRCDDCHGNTTAVTPDIPASGLSANHIATNGTDCGVCHTPGTFTTGIFDHATIGTARCDSCHDGSISKGVSLHHIPTNGADCNGCHGNTDSFATAVVMDHALVDVSVCSACHDGDISSGKPNNHVPTKALDCKDCHYDFDSFALTTFDHAAIEANDCASCHDAGFATPKSTNHIPSVSECSVCHTDTSVGGFKNNNFRAAVHDSLTTGCEGCHISTFFPDNSAAYKSATHLPTTQDCYLCHSAAAADFTTSIFSHQGISSNCVSCHNGSANNVAANAVGEPNDSVHTGIDGDCSICHNTVAWAPQDVDHTRSDVLSVRCDSCHNGNFEPGIPGKNQGHTATSSDCSVCHKTTTFVGGMVDHSSPQVTSVRCDSCHNGTDATGVSDHPTNKHIPTTDDCGACHKAGGSFKPSTFAHVGVTNNCETCHNGNFVDSGAAGKNAGHVTTSSDCAVCHNTEDFSVARFDHSTVSSTTRCDSCHNGTTAAAKEPPVGHVPTNQDCRDCHQTTGFKPATFAHTGIVDNCSSCHDAGYATPKSSGHITTSLDCGVCHSGFDTFKGATFDHSTVSSSTRCDSCHDGSTAKGKADAVPAHLATNLDCRSCHTTATFKGGTWEHDASASGRCDECHSSGNGATPKSSGHINTTAQCDDCHTTSGWGFDHPLSIPGLGGSGPYNPLDHRKPLSCTDCHGNTITPIIPNNEWSNTNYKPYCAGCHDRDYDTGERRHRGIDADKDCYGSCHEHSINSGGFD